MRDGTAISEVLRERQRQDDKWGIQRHDSLKWLAILGEEYGEIAKAILECQPDEIVAEITQVAAVAVAWLTDILGNE